MKETDCGPRIYEALKAVAAMHRDTSRLLVDCDQLFSDSTPVFGNYATADLSYHVGAEVWMAEGVYRFWRRKSEETVSGVTAILYDRKQRIEQPLFVVGQLSYVAGGEEEMSKICNRWDLWNAVLEWPPQLPELNAMHTLASPKEHRECLGKIIFEVAPLYSIDSLEAVREMFRHCGVDTQ